jgi:hypothetical protein
VHERVHPRIMTRDEQFGSTTPGSRPGTRCHVPSQAKAQPSLRRSAQAAASDRGHVRVRRADRAAARLGDARRLERM